MTTQIPGTEIISIHWIHAAEAEVLARMKEISAVFRGIRVPRFTEGLKTYPSTELSRPLLVALGYHIFLLNESLYEDAGGDFYLGNFCRQAAPARTLRWGAIRRPITQKDATKYVLRYEEAALRHVKFEVAPIGYDPDKAPQANYNSLDLVTLFFRKPHVAPAADAEKAFAKRVLAAYGRIFGDERPERAEDFLRPFVEMTGFNPDTPDLEDLLRSCGVFFDKREAKIATALTSYISQHGTKDINWSGIRNAVNDPAYINLTHEQFGTEVRRMFFPYFHHHLHDYRQLEQDGKESKKEGVRADHVPPDEISTKFTAGDIATAMLEDMARGIGRKGLTGTPTQTKRMPKSPKPKRPTHGRQREQDRGVHND
jgi:hypothetical protein